MYEFVEEFEEDIPTIERMTILRLEYGKYQDNEKMSELIEDFFFDMQEESTNTYDKLLSVFNTKATEDLLILLNNCDSQEEIIGVIVQGLCLDGILAEISMRDHNDWKFKEDGSFKSCRGDCSSTLKWIYADTVEGLLIKMNEESEKHWEDSMNKAKEKQQRKVDNE